MIDLKDLRENPQKYAEGCRKKGSGVDIPRLVELDARLRTLRTEQETLRAEQNRLAKETGPQIGKLQGQLKSAQGPERDALQKQIDEIKSRPQQLKAKIEAIEPEIARIEPELHAMLLSVPLPPDDDVPVGTSSDDNVERERWAPDNWDWKKSFEQNRGFTPRNHLELVRDLKLADFERGVKLSGSRSYVLTGDGMRLHQAVLRFAMDMMVGKGFEPISVPVIVREEAMVGTGFFPAGREQAYHINESQRQHADDPEAKSKGQDLYLTGTGEVGLMGLHMDEILDEASLPLRYCTVSTCFRREAGAAGKDTAGLYRIHQFDKVEQVVICRADEQESRRWHREMIAYVQELLRALELPHRLLQCCTGDLGPKNADMIDVECWMPGRGAIGADGVPAGDFGETHSASRLYDYQCRRLNMRYRPSGEGASASSKPATVFCHSLNNTVAASPRILIPILEMHQQKDGTVRVPKALVPYVGKEVVGT
ncbi:MAG: serine--tRNA ligase [Phycisphaerales bacterium]|jgi:seryl-tRNA synthetase|nr:serine--tRNA ligase [Phycisphaerales bacterium]